MDIQDKLQARSEREKKSYGLLVVEEILILVFTTIIGAVIGSIIMTLFPKKGLTTAQMAAATKRDISLGAQIGLVTGLVVGGIWLFRNLSSYHRHRMDQGQAKVAGYLSGLRE